VDRDTLWIALREGHSIWRMNLADGVLHHVAGTGQAGYAGDGGPASESKFNGPKGIAVAQDGNVFVADTENNAIRRIDTKSGLITTVAGIGPTSKVGAGQRNISKDAQLNRPHGICAAPDGDLFIGDSLNHRVSRVH
jgi:streptogramin lyase